MLMNQSSRDDTVDGVRPPRPPARDAVSPQSSRDKRSKRSLTATSPTEGKPISGVFGASDGDCGSDRLDDVDVAGGVVGDLVGDRAEEAADALHAAVADDDDVGLEAVGLGEQRRGRLLVEGGGRGLDPLGAVGERPAARRSARPWSGSTRGRSRHPTLIVAASRPE